MILDRIDRAILRLFLQYPDSWLTTNKIAEKVEVTPRTAKKHLTKLMERNWLNIRTRGKNREYERK